MTDAGWHPDPHGRADRRYHDGTGWTAHIADAEGTASRDPHGAGADPQPPPAAPVIGPPPPRTAPTPAPAAADPEHTQQISATDLPPPPADPADAVPWADPADDPDDEPDAATADIPAGPVDVPAPGPADVPPDVRADPAADLPVVGADPAARVDVPAGRIDEPVARADRTQQLSAADLAAATSLAKAAGNTDHTVQMSAEEVAAAAALASAAPPPVEARQGPHTEPISTQDLTAAAAALAAGEGRPDGDRVRTRPRLIAVVGALIGIGLAVAGLLLLPWATGGGGTDASYLDVRDAVDTFGSGDSAATTAFVLTGALFAVGVGGVVALARAIGAAPVRAIAAVVALLGAAGLAVLGYAAIDVEGARATAPGTEVIDPDAGSPVTLPDGTPVTDPATGSPVTVPEGGIDPGQVSEEAVADVFTARAEDHLTSAAIVGAVLLVLAGLLALVGLGLRGTAGHVVTAAGLLVVAGWAIVALLGLRDAGDVGSGPTVLVAGTVVLALSAAVPGRRRRPDPAPEAP